LNGVLVLIMKPWCKSKNI